MTRFSFGLLVVIPEILPNHSIIHSQAQDIIKGYPRWGNSRHLILLSPRVCSAWWIYGAQARCSNSFQQVFSNFLLQIYQQTGFLCHVNLYTITSTAVSCVWNETQLLGLCRAGKSLVIFAARQAMPLYWKPGRTFWCSINTWWLSSQLFIQPIPAIFCYEKLCLILLFIPTYTYSTFQHLILLVNPMSKQYIQEEKSLPSF